MQMLLIMMSYLPQSTTLRKILNLSQLKPKLSEPDTANPHSSKPSHEPAPTVVHNTTSSHDEMDLSLVSVELENALQDHLN